MISNHQEAFMSIEDLFGLVMLALFVVPVFVAHFKE